MSQLTKGVDSCRKRKGFSCYYVSINRRKQYFATTEERDAKFNNEAAMRALGISDDEAPRVTPRDQLDLSEMKKMVDGHSAAGNLLEVFKAGVATLPKVTMSLEAARNEFVAEKEAAVAANAMKKNSCKQQRVAVDNMIREARFTLMADVKNPAFGIWLKSRGMSPKGLHSYCKALGVFLNWASAKKYLAANPLADIPVPEPPPKRTVFSVKQTRHVFDVAQKKFPELVPLLAVMWFAGVRPETAMHIEYSDIDRAEKAITLRRGKFEQGEVEFVEGIPETLWHWLPKKRTGKIAPTNCGHLLTALHHDLGYSRSNPWPQDVARHTFVSHFAALVRNMEAVAFAINHKRASTTLKYYRRRVPRQEGERYFAMRPGPVHRRPQLRLVA